MTDKPQPCFQVQVIETATGAVEQSFDCGTSRRKAEKIENALNINMNHAEFHTEIVEQ